MAIACSGLFLTEDANCPAPSGSVATSPLEITCALVVLLSTDVIDEAFVVVFVHMPLILHTNQLEERIWN
ncbi:MAG: hypothetical protein ACR2IS_02845 [Nitrososphaeraceae archaeon]